MVPERVCVGEPWCCETLSAPSTSSQRGKGKRLTLNTNHSISISHTLELAELACLVAGYTRRECPHQRNRWGGCPSLWGSTALPGCQHPGKSCPTTFLMPRATRAAPAKPQPARSAQQQPLASAPCRWEGMHQRAGAEPGLPWSSSRGTFPFQSAMGVVCHQNGCPCGKECVWVNAPRAMEEPSLP